MALLTADQVKARIGAKAEEWDDDRIDRLVARFEDLLAEHLGLFYGEREVTETIRSIGGDLLLGNLDVTEITAVSVDGTALGDLDLLDLDGGTGIVHGFNRRGAVVVTYTCDNAAPNAALDGCVEFVKARYIGQTTTRNPQIESYDDPSGYTYTVGRADPANKRWTGIVTVDDALAELAGASVPLVG